MLSFFIILVKTTFILSVITLLLFKILTKEKNIFKNENYLYLLYFTIGLIFVIFMLLFSANIILGGYKNTIFSIDNFGIFFVLITTCIAIFEPLILLGILTKNVLFIIHSIKNNYFNRIN